MKSTDAFIRNFYAYAQELIDQTYLQPFDGSFKDNLKEGGLERGSHGALHASRVSAYVKVLHSLITEMFPNYAKHSLAIISKDLKLSAKEIINFTSFAGLCHDSARKGEGKDFWDNQSGRKCINFLKKKGIPKKSAEVFGFAAAYKDHPNQYADCLKKLGISKNNIAAFDYLRKLIQLSDCFDIMRLREEFQLKYVFRTLKDVPIYRSKIHDAKIIELTKEIYKLIISHHDMATPCSVLLPDNRAVFINKAAVYNVQEKIKYEHADNVLKAVMLSMKKKPYFAKYLKGEVIPHKKETVENKTKQFNNQSMNPFKYVLGIAVVGPIAGIICYLSTPIAALAFAFTVLGTLLLFSNPLLALVYGIVTHTATAIALTARTFARNAKHKQHPVESPISTAMCCGFEWANYTAGVDIYGAKAKKCLFMFNGDFNHNKKKNTVFAPQNVSGLLPRFRSSQL